MPVTNEKKMEMQEDGTEKEVLTLKFSNGALQQIEDLAKFIGTNDSVDVIKLGISFLQKVKEDKEKSNSEK